MPHTLGRVRRIIDWLERRHCPPITLLVVPGCDWTKEQLAELRALAAAGYELAAHGWTHQTKPRRLYHRLHAALISRNVAEHLALEADGILALLERSALWFEAHQLPRPETYVPPAWALGAVPLSRLAAAPFRRIETTRGLLHLPASGAHASLGTRNPVRFEKLPLTGYEADTPLREFFLRRWNAVQMRVASRHGRPLRLSIHPDDLQLRVADQLTEQLAAVDTCLPYRSYAPPSVAEPI